MTSVAVMSLAAGFLHSIPELVLAQEPAGLRLRVEVLKRSTFEQEVVGGPVLIGPQSALELEWRLLNGSDETLEIPSLTTALGVRVLNQGDEIPVGAAWALDMTLATEINGQRFPVKVPSGFVELPGASSLRVRGSVRRIDGSVFAPGEYTLQLRPSLVPQPSGDGTRTGPRVDVGHPIRIRIVEMSSPARERQFHILEGGFYTGTDAGRALQHYRALASMPGAPWSDSLPLARMYGNVGRHREASDVFRRILPDLIRGLDTPLGNIVRNSGLLRRAAMSFAVEGDLAAARNLLRLEGRIRENQIPEEIERLRQTAPKLGLQGQRH